MRQRAKDVHSGEVWTKQDTIRGERRSQRSEVNLHIQWFCDLKQHLQIDKCKDPLIRHFAAVPGNKAMEGRRVLGQVVERTTEQVESSQRHCRRISLGQSYHQRCAVVHNCRGWLWMTR